MGTLINVKNDIGVILKQLFDNLIFLNIFLSIIIIFFQRKEAKSTWAWLLLLYAIPILGFVIYLLAGTDMHKRKMFKTKGIEDRISEAIQKQETSIINREFQLNDPQISEYSDLILYNLEASGSVLDYNNKVQVFTDGVEKFETLMEDIRYATDYIHIQYYIIRDDFLFQDICELLIVKAMEGVEVRILYDGMGCRGISKRFWKNLNKNGIKTVEFFPPLLRKLHLRINYRNHRKIVVIDGKIAYMGGFNIGKEYVGQSKRFGYWRDTHLKIEGSSVNALQVRFLLDWNYASRENLFSKEKYLAEKLVDKTGESRIQIISSGPDSRMPNIRNNYLRLITKAKKSIYIQTPYFIPDDAIMSSLLIAVYSGIEVNIMIPCKPDHPFVYWATYSYIGDLVKAGANCYTYQNGFLHAKGMIIDSKVLCYGTANMDIRSFDLNFEVNAVIYDEDEAKKMQNIFQEDIKKSDRITKDKYFRRTFIIRVKEQISRLLSPLL